MTNLDEIARLAWIAKYHHHRGAEMLLADILMRDIQCPVCCKCEGYCQKYVDCKMKVVEWLNQTTNNDYREALEILEEEDE